MYGKTIYWRDTFRNPRFFILDGRIAGVMLIFVMHITLWTFLLLVITAGVLWYFERKSVKPEDILRFLRSSLIGRRRTARGVNAERSAVDYGFETDADVAAVAARIAQRDETHKQQVAKAAAKSAGSTAAKGKKS